VLARRILARDHGVAFLTSCPLAGAGYQESVAPFYDTIREAAAVLDLPVASLDRFWDARVVEGRAGSKALHQVDGIHPTDEGHAILAQGLFEAFEGWGLAQSEVSEAEGA
jgi:lysophospholipase L1-like esterase